MTGQCHVWQCRCARAELLCHRQCGGLCRTLCIRQMRSVGKFQKGTDGGKGQEFTTLYDNLRHLETTLRHCATLRHLITISVAFFPWHKRHKMSYSIIKRHEASYDTLRQFMTNSVPSPSSRPLLNFTGAGCGGSSLSSIIIRDRRASSAARRRPHSRSGSENCSGNWVFA